MQVARRWLTAVVGMLGMLFVIPAEADDAQKAIMLQTPLSAPFYPVLLTGAAVPDLQRIDIGALRLYAVHDNKVQPIAFQIDQRDRHGDLQLSTPNASARMDDNDECVLLAGSAGARMTEAQRAGRVYREIGLRDTHSGAEAWLYVRAGDEPLPTTGLRYDARSDSVVTDSHRLRFSEKTRMLLADLQWLDRQNGQWSPDLLDTMKVRHTGLFLHRYEFLRTDADYVSRLVGVKVGPLRIIRRTDNRVALFMGLKSPSIRVDMLVYTHAMVADMRLDIPFPVGWFFRDIVTTTSLDGLHSAGVTQTLLAGPHAVTINGRMDAGKQALNGATEADFALANLYGAWAAGVDFGARLPLHSRVQVVDDLRLADPPEEEVGQYGNAGFRLTGFEALRSGSYHLHYRVYLLPAASGADALAALRQAPVGPAVPTF